MVDAKPGSIVYGSWKDGSDIYKDSKGYYILQYDPKTDTIGKKHLKGWKPPAAAEDRLCRVGTKWKTCKAAAGAAGKKGRATRRRR